MDSIVHFEIPVTTPEDAKKFYTEVFGWSMESWGGEGGEYWMTRTTEVDEQTQMPKQPGAINGGIFERTEPFTGPVLVINVDDIDTKLKEIEAAGGTTVKEKTPVGEMGWVAYFNDGQGNLMGIWQINPAGGQQ